MATNNNTLSLNKNSAAGSVANEAEAADAAAAAAVAAQATAEAAVADEPVASLRKALISVAERTMVHLFTSQVVNQTPSLMEIDQFAQTQLDAGKWVETKL